MRYRLTSKLLIGAAAVGCCTLAACRRDMHIEPRYNPLAESRFFADGRSARPMVEGTVARGHMTIDQARYTGKINGDDVDQFPIPITKADIERGQQRFNIYCTPCHGRLGDGNGLVVLRGFKQPPSYYSDRLMHAPVGHFFDVMTNGFGAMASYASRVEPDDRWRIAAYIRALQLSESATAADVPADQLANLPVEPPLRTSGESNNLPTGGEQPINENSRAPISGPPAPTPQGANQ